MTCGTGKRNNSKRNIPSEGERACEAVYGQVSSILFIRSVAPLQEA